jgi:hypothetical protein
MIEHDLRIRHLAHLIDNPTNLVCTSQKTSTLPITNTSSLITIVLCGTARNFALLNFKKNNIVFDIYMSKWDYIIV